MSGLNRLLLVIFALIELGWGVVIGAAYVDLRHAEQRVAESPPPVRLSTPFTMDDLMAGDVDPVNLARKTREDGEQWQHDLAVAERETAATNLKILIGCLVGTPLLILLIYGVLRWIALGFRQEGAA